jgi:hypothetical protein
VRPALGFSKVRVEESIAGNATPACHQIVEIAGLVDIVGEARRLEDLDVELARHRLGQVPQEAAGAEARLQNAGR